MTELLQNFLIQSDSLGIKTMSPEELRAFKMEFFEEVGPMFLLTLAILILLTMAAALYVLIKRSQK
jgi:hypothetical protein